MENKILIVGKIYYHLDFSISENFSILSSEEGTRSTNASDVKRVLNGMAVNVAYGLAILGSYPIVVSQVGYEFNWFYLPHLEKLGIDVRSFIHEEKETAYLYRIQDGQNKNLLISQENSYHFFAERDLEDQLESNEFQGLNAVFIGTGKVEADVKFISKVNGLNKLPLIYSPDKNVLELTKWRLTQIFDKISVLICTEDELNLIQERMKQTCDEILTNFKRLKYIISMVQRSRIIIFSREFKMKIADGPADEVLSPDFWYDAFRAGVIYGISLKKPIEEAAKLGSALASYAVESRENMQYSPSLEQVSLRAFEVKATRKVI
ncbi:MAG: PfkB family carbohydrate kinase [Candidatus Hodarchaeota archaeon]